MTQDKESKVFKKISEIRKKISLCEGKRRAFYSVTEKEKSLNKEKTFLLQDELKVGMIDCNNKQSFDICCIFSTVSIKIFKASF